MPRVDDLKKSSSERRQSGFVVSRSNGRGKWGWDFRVILSDFQLGNERRPVFLDIFT
jgi:hypothetical protein